MSGGLQMLMSRGNPAAGNLDYADFSATDIITGGTAEAYAEFYTDGSAGLFGSSGTSPTTPRWWTISPPSTWMSYTSTGIGTITGGLVAGTRYQLNATRKLGNQRTTFGVATRVFTITFFDASTGGNTLGTKTFTASAEYA
jgi:hypothetical protein